MNETRQPEAVIVVAPEDLQYVIGLAADHDVEVEEAEVHGIEPVITVTLLLFGATAAVAAVQQFIETHKGGQVIDLRPTAPKFAYRDKGVVYGIVIIIATDGKVTVEVHEPKGMFGQVMEALTKVAVDTAKASIEAIGEAAKKAVGNTADVRVEPA